MHGCFTSHTRKSQFTMALFLNQLRFGFRNSYLIFLRVMTEWLELVHEFKSFACHFWWLEQRHTNMIDCLCYSLRKVYCVAATDICKTQNIFQPAPHFQTYFRGHVTGCHFPPYYLKKNFYLRILSTKERCFLNFIQCLTSSLMTMLLRKYFLYNWTSF